MLTGDSAGAGKLIVPKKALILSSCATEGIFSILPIWNPAGYYEFAQVIIRDSLTGHGMTVETGESERIGFKFRNAVEPYYRSHLLNDGGSDNGLTVLVEMSWAGEDGRATQTFEYKDSVVGTVCSSTNMDYYFNLYGFSVLEINLSSVEMRGKIVLDCGIELSTRTFTPNS